MLLAVDLDALLLQRGLDVLGGDRAEEPVLFADLAREGDLTPPSFSASAAASALRLGRARGRDRCSCSICFTL